MPELGNVVPAIVQRKAGRGWIVNLDKDLTGYLPGGEAIGKLNNGKDILVKLKSGGRDQDFLVTMKHVRQPDPEWWNPLNEGFYNDLDKKELKAELFEVFAQKVAEACAKDLHTNALRNFYDAFKGIESRLKQAADLEDKERIFRQQLPLIKMMRARVAHSQEKSTTPIPPLFANFLNDSIDIISDRKDFDGFMLLFEAVAGWHTYYSKEK